jgi:DNA adenine methylase
VIHERLRSVQFECREALSVINDFDSPETTFYLDPPYVLETRGNNKYYAVEPGDDFHDDLVDTCLRAKGAVVLSGYLHPAYEPLMAAGWRLDTFAQTTTMDIEHASLKGKTRARTEVVFRNPRAADYSMMRPLF